MNYAEVSNALLDEFIENENLKKHCYAVESSMKFYAGKLGEDEERWGAAGLLHDLDWEKFPDTHPNTAIPVLEDAGFDRDFIDAILGHAYPERTQVPRESLMAKYLYACDEITGLVNAYSLMKPDGLGGVEPKGVIKKMKDKAFARNVSREDILKGAEEAGLDLSGHIMNIITAMRGDERLR